MLFDELQVLCPAIEAIHMARVLDDEIDQHAGVDHMIVNQEVVGVLDEWPVHVRHPVDAHQHHAAGRAYTNHKAGEQGQADQQMAIFDQERRDRRHSRRREHREHVVEGLGVGEKANNGEAWHKNLVRGGVEKRPRHEKTKIKNEKFFDRGRHSRYTPVLVRKSTVVWIASYSRAGIDLSQIDQ